MTTSRHAFPPAGPAHPLVRHYLDLKRNRTVDRGRTVTIEGLWALRHALDARAPVEAVFVCPALFRGAATEGAIARAGERGAMVLEVSERVIRRLVDRDGPDGLAAIACLPSVELEDVAVTGTTRLVVVDGLEGAGNVGAIIRAADGAGAAAVIVTNERVRVTHPMVVKASMGTAFTTPLVDADDDTVLAWLRDHRFRIVAADPSGRRSYRGDHYRGPVALVVGSERNGLRAHWRTRADVTVSIPMVGVADSLNVAHAAALLLYEALHQGRGGSG